MSLHISSVINRDETVDLVNTRQLSSISGHGKIDRLLELNVSWNFQAYFRTNCRLITIFIYSGPSLQISHLFKNNLTFNLNLLSHV